MPNRISSGDTRKVGRANFLLKQLSQTEESAGQKLKSELDSPVDDIDKDLRKALAYFG